MYSFFTSLIAYVAVPIAGLLWFGWDWRTVVILYWLENVTLGVQTLIRMGRAPKIAEPGSRMRFSVNGTEIGSANPGRGGALLFFTAHYGIFTTVHGIFVMGICATPLLTSLPVFAGSGVGAGAPGATAGSIDWLGLIIVWLISSAVLLVQTCREPKDELLSAQAQMMRPYGRVIALHLTILGGVGLILWLGWPPIAAIALAVFHFVLDLAFNRRQFFGRVADRSPVP